MNIEKIASKLRAASLAYHNAPNQTVALDDGGGNTGERLVMTDAEYDALEDELRRLSPDHPVFSEVGAPAAEGWVKVAHPIPMGSLNKVQTVAEYNDWVNTKVAPILDDAGLFYSEKMDGISIDLIYKNGELAQAITRGDGVEGQDITRNVRIMQGVQTKIMYQKECYVRGEIVCRKSDFAKYFQGESNPRNTAAGKATAQSDWQRARHLTVYAYNLTSSDPNDKAETREEEFETLETWGFLTPGHGRVTQVQVIDLRMAYINNRRDACDYLIDGLVIELNNTALRESMGAHNMRPKGAMAFKFPHEAKPTFLRDILWQVGNSGRVTPVAVFDPVELAGANVTRASLHNVDRVQKLQLFRNCRILVSRRNDVIPFVEVNLSEGIRFDGEEI
jgi:DNA ligase (NAD+)